MSLKIVTYILMILLFLLPTAQQVKAQVNETELIPDGTNSTIPLPSPGNTTLGNFTMTNTTLANTTIPDVNATSPGINETEPVSEPLSMEILASIQAQVESRQSYMLLLLGEATLPPEIANGMMHAKQAMDKAMNFEENNIRAAAQQYLQAMKHYRNALGKYLKDNPGAITVFGSESNSTASDDLNTTVTEAEISAAKIQLISQFQERFQDQLTAMYQYVSKVSGDLSPEDFVKVQRALSKAEEKLAHIQEKILNGQFDEALDDLEETTDTLDEDVNELEDPGAAQMFRTVNKLQARIEKLEQRAALKAAKGESTDELDALLEELRGIKDKVKSEFKANNGKGNGKSNGKGNGKNKDKSNNDKNK
jgi:hypothetical protein